jgi:hypothetical protein
VRKEGQQLIAVGGEGVTTGQHGPRKAEFWSAGGSLWVRGDEEGHLALLAGGQFIFPKPHHDVAHPPEMGLWRVPVYHVL